jgi:hypothetical protein
VRSVSVEARSMVEERLLLAEDAERIIAEAQKNPVFDGKK